MTTASVTAESPVSFWENWNLISRHQAAIAANYRSMFGFDAYQSLLQLAPTYLSQSINPWTFSLMNFTQQIKGSAVVEEKIITEVAGYGSQLGTIIDVVELLVEKLESRNGTQDHEAIYKVMRLKHLADDINKAKGL